jgi:hypothetical protein
MNTQCNRCRQWHDPDIDCAHICMTPYERGASDHDIGLTKNPFPTGSLDADEWINGWYDASEKRSQPVARTMR